MSSVETTQPLVSCLMVTRNRRQLAQRAVRCFAKQTWPRTELVIIDDGETDYEPILAPYRADHIIHYHRLPHERSRKLGALRNIALDAANGPFCTQWDDDEWYHPQRIEVQMRAIERAELGAVLLRSTLMHLDAPEFVDHPYRTELAQGTPGTILHRRTSIRYLNLPRAEDSHFRKALSAEMAVGLVLEPHSHLFIRCHHGRNTWDVRHFTERLHRGPRHAWEYFKAQYVKRDLFSHPLFALTGIESEAVQHFLRDSRELGLLPA